MFYKKSLQTLFFSCLTILLLTSFSALAQKNPKVEDGKGLVVFYRAKKFSGSAIKFTVKDSRGEYGQLKSGTIISVPVETGSNTFWSQVISSDSITIEVEEGKIYYVKGTVKMGAIAGRPKFNLVDESKALKEIKKL